MMLLLLLAVGQRSWIVLSLLLLLLLCRTHGGVGASGAQEVYVTADGNEYLSNVDYGDGIGVQQYMDEDHMPEIQRMLQQARAYLQSNPSYQEDGCQNNHESCVVWAFQGECERNPRFMNVTCPPMCRACDSLITDDNCRRDPNGIDSWQPGDVNRIFEDILVQQAHYGLQVLARPYLAPGDTEETASYKIGPWMIVMENFLTDEESDLMAALGERTGYAPTSYRSEEQLADEALTATIQHTASVVYCQNECYDDPTHQMILERMANIMQLPKENYEFFQMIRYNTGEWFKTHNDFAPHHALKPEGVRVLTFLVYHSHVQAGGGTSFNQLGLTVMPKKGRAVIFPLVLNEDPNTRDNNLDHEALIVEQGIKYAFNTHAHQRDYMTPFHHGCGT